MRRLKRVSSWRVSVAKAPMINPKRGAFVAASSAIAAIAWRELRHRAVSYADLTEANLRIERLFDLRDDAESLALIESGLREEWGPFALLGFASIEQMATDAGKTIFVIAEPKGDSLTPKGALQTILTDVHGDPDLLREMYPTFDDLTGAATWQRSRSRGGDTAVLLQITVFDEEARGRGIGTLLRNAALQMLADRVRHVLTMTPVGAAAGEGGAYLTNPASHTAAMRFHTRGGATPVAFLPAFKAPRDDGSRHGRDVVVMRYERDNEGGWPAPRPAMRVRSVGPLRETLSKTAPRLRALRAKGRGVLAARDRHAA